jgi:signal transduction histidine kinase
MFYKFKTLKQRFSIIYLFLVFLIAIISSASIISLLQLEKAVNNILVDNYKSISTVNSMIEAIERQDSGLLTYISMNNDAGTKLFNNNTQDFLKNLFIEENNITEKGEGTIVNRIDSNYKTYIQMFSSMQQIRITNGQNAAYSYYISNISGIFGKIKTDLKSLSKLNEDAMFARKRSAADNAKSSTYVLIIISFIAISSGFFISRHYVKKHLKPLSSLTDSISKVNAGEFNSKLEINSSDEIGKLASEFNNMLIRLKQYEESNIGTLMAEKNKSETIVKNITDPLFILDNNYKVELINNACESVFNIDENAVLGKHFLEIVHDGDMFNFIFSAAGGSLERTESIMMLNLDRDYYFNVVVTKTFNPNKSINKIVVFMQNITELKKLEKVRTDFIATVSHELKTPLTSILMGASMLDSVSLGALSAEQTDIVKAIKEDGERLSNLVNELLELSKIQSGRAIYNITMCSLNSIAENSIIQFAEMIQYKDVSLINELPDNMPNVNADFEKITWVFNNLINNSLKYTNAGDTITLSAKINKNEIEVSINDTGVGIPQEYLNKIFDGYMQYDGKDIEYRGTGIGLQLVKEIVTAHQGRIWAKSELDAGSTFTFTLPINKGG